MAEHAKIFLCFGMIIIRLHWSYNIKINGCQHSCMWHRYIHPGNIRNSCHFACRTERFFPPGNIIIFAYDILVCEMKQSCYIWLNKILSQSINIHITLNYFSITTKTNKTFYPIIVMFIFNITYPVACLLSSTDYLFWVSILLILYFQIVWEVLLSTV